MSMITKRFFLLAAIVIIWVVLACSLSQLLPERQARVTSTATRTPKPTFTATSTPTTTPIPTLTPTPSNTPTNTPVPTDTPIPTDTPVPTLTPTETPTPPPSATPTATTKPTPRPTRKPTNTPVPAPTKPPAPPFTGSVVNGLPNCGTKGVMGKVKHGDGSGFPGIVVGVWSDAWQGRLSGPSESTGKYDIGLTDLPPGKFYVAVVNPDTCGSRDGVPTAIDCQRRSNVVSVTIFETNECNNKGTVQWSEVHFTGQ